MKGGSPQRSEPWTACPQHCKPARTSRKVRELAEHPDIDVSTGLASKVKRALVEEGYAIERQSLLYLRDPVGLLEDWARNYAGPAEKLSMYFRGGASDVERAIARWCKRTGIRFALAGFSAAWRLAPEVRYSVATAYIESRGFDRECFDLLRSDFGGNVVETGPNVQLWRPFDISVFVNSESPIDRESPATSALQTYLDLKRAAGRGEDAAKAVFEKYLSHDLQAVIEREKDQQYGAV